MARGDGITRIMGPDGKPRYVARASVTDPRTGKRSQPQATHSTPKAARAWKADIESQAARGAYQGRSDRTVGELVAAWLDLEARRSVGLTTYENYAQVVRLHIVPALGAIPLQKLTTERIERHYADMLERGYAQSSVALVHAVFRQALDRAVRDKLLPANPAAVRMKVLGRGGKRRQGAAPPWKTWTREEVRSFLSVVPQSKHGPLFAVLLGTGMRRGEALGLQWADLTPCPDGGQNGWLHVQRAIEPVEDGRQADMGETKNHQQRHVPILPALSAQLLAWREQAAPAAPTAYIFPGRYGDGWMDPDATAYDFGRLIKLAGVPRIRMHDCRHTFAQLSLEAGVPIHAISKWLGHSSVEVTMRIYMHVTAALEQQGIEKLARIFAPPEDHSEASCAPTVRLVPQIAHSTSGG